MSRNTKFKKIISLLFIFNLCAWVVLGSKLENPDWWKMWIDTQDEGQLSTKRITAKSIFGTPCSNGGKEISNRCVQEEKINPDNMKKYLLDRAKQKYKKKNEPNREALGSNGPFNVNIPFNYHQQNNPATAVPPVNPFIPNHLDSGSKHQNVEQTTLNIIQTIQEILQNHDATMKPLQFSSSVHNLLPEDINANKNIFTSSAGPDIIRIQTSVPETTKVQTETTSHRQPGVSKSDYETTNSQTETTATDFDQQYETVMLITEKPKKKIITSSQAYDVPTENSRLSPTTETIPPTNVQTTLDQTSLTTLLDRLLASNKTKLVDIVTTERMTDPPTSTIVQPTYSTLVNNLENTTLRKATANSITTLFSKETDVPSTTFNSEDTTLQTVANTNPTKSPFLIIVTDPSSVAENKTRSEPDYVLISNSSNSLLQKLGYQVELDKKVIGKRCLESDMNCSDDVVLPPFESIKIVSNTRTNGTKIESNAAPEENNKIIQLLPQESTDDTAEKVSNPNVEVLNNKNEHLSAMDSMNLMYESLKTPTKIDLRPPPESTTVKTTTPPNTLLNIIMQPTSKTHSSTPVYSPSTTFGKPNSLTSTSTTTTTQKSPLLTTTRRIYTHPELRPPLDYFTGQTGFSLPANPIRPQQTVSTDFLYSSGSSEQFAVEPNLAYDYNTYDSSRVQFPSEYSTTNMKYPNSKFSSEFHKTFAAAPGVQQSSSGNLVRFPTISRTPASTYNSISWPNTRWTPQQQQQQQQQTNNAVWESRWPPAASLGSQYYNQNSRYQQNVPVANYVADLLQI